MNGVMDSIIIGSLKEKKVVNQGVVTYTSFMRNIIHKTIVLLYKSSFRLQNNKGSSRDAPKMEIQTKIKM